MSTAHTQFPPGTVLLGKYRIEHVLGAGGMGVVAMATHLQLNERVALKFLLPEVMGDPVIVQRFLREAQAAVKLKGEHVARVIDVGTLETGVPYMVMEYLEGGDMSQLIGQSGPLPTAIAVDYALQACAALAEAHALGIVHRDIKPANFFITRRPDGSALLKVLDFGISKAAVGVDPGLTRTQAVMGTPAYMSPEQMRSSRDVDARSDIWSLGVVIYELLAGMRPFQSESFSELCLKVAMDPLAPLHTPHAPGLDLVVQRCLEKDPGHRFQNVAELAAALVPHAQYPDRAQLVVERAARTLGLQAQPVAPGLVPTPTAGATPGPAPPTSLSAAAGQFAARPARTKRVGIIVAGITALVAAGVLVIVLGTGGGKKAQPSASGDPAAGAASAGTAPADTGNNTEVTEGARKSGAMPAAVNNATPASDAGVAAAEPPPATSPIDAAPAVELAKPTAARRTKRTRTRRTKPRKKPAADPGDYGEDDVLGNRN